MGLWWQFISIYGPTEEWRPDFPGDWPADPDPFDPSPSLGIIPEPCPRCGGELTRRRWSNEERVKREHARAMATWERLGKKGDEPKPEPVMEGWRYTLSHYKHRLVEEASVLERPKRARGFDE